MRSELPQIEDRKKQFGRNMIFACIAVSITMTTTLMAGDKPQGTSLFACYCFAFSIPALVSIVLVQEANATSSTPYRPVWFSFVAFAGILSTAVGMGGAFWAVDSTLGCFYAIIVIALMILWGGFLKHVDRPIDDDQGVRVQPKEAE